MRGVLPMNDFTKDELTLIMMCVTYRGTMHLIDKIQAMIDNYCKHEPSEPKLVLIKHCVKCNQHLETRQWGLHDYK
jgi:hypothetical protein